MSRYIPSLYSYAYGDPTDTAGVALGQLTTAIQNGYYSRVVSIFSDLDAQRHGTRIANYMIAYHRLLDTGREVRRNHDASRTHRELL